MGTKFDDPRLDETNSTENADDLFRGYLTEAEFAARCGLSRRTLQRRRQLREAPPHVVFGKQILYRVDAVREWLRQSERDVARTPTTRRKRSKS